MAFVSTGVLGPIATSGAYNDLTGKPTLGALAAKDTVTEADIAQGASGIFVIGRSASTGAVARVVMDALTATANTVVQRGASGVIVTGTPTATGHATTKTYVDTALNLKANILSLSTVATSGSYNDLSNQPTFGSLATKSKVAIVDIDATGTPSSATFLKGDGTWGTVAGAGTVTSVGLSAPTGFTVSNSPVTGSGTLTITYTSGYQGYTTAEATKLSGIATGAQVNTVTSVAGRTGAVTLAKADVGLGNVDNTSEADKPISTATQAAITATNTDVTNRIIRDTASHVGFDVGNIESPYIRHNTTGTGTLFYLATRAYADTKASIYTGDVTNEINFPIGHNVGYQGGNRALNSSVVVRLGSNTGSFNEYLSSGSNTSLAGVWRHHGGTGQQGSGGWFGGIAQRTE